MPLKRGYYFVSGQTEWLPDLSGLALSQLLDMLDACSYACEAGSLRWNVAYLELRRRAEQVEAAPVAGEDIGQGRAVYRGTDGLLYMFPEAEGAKPAEERLEG